MSAGAKLAQSVHAAFRFAQEHPHLTEDWMKNSEYICVLEIENEMELEKLLGKARETNVATSVFNEADLDNSLTAIALAPGSESKRLCSQLPLALKDKS